MAQRKRGQNEGSVYRRQDGRWAAAVSLGNGRRKSVYGRNAVEVREKLESLRRDVAEGRSLFDDRRTVGQALDAWLAAKKTTVRPKTFESYSGLVRRHAMPVMRDLRLSALRVYHLEQLYSERADYISPKTVRNLHFVIESALNWATRRDWIGRNPAALITSEDLPRIERRETRILSAKEARLLISKARGTKSEALITLALQTGIRVGELMGLTWDRVDLMRNRIRITHSLQYLDGEATLVEPKTKAAFRELALPPGVTVALRRHRVGQNETALSLGKLWDNKHDLVFTTKLGAPLNRHAVLRQYLRPLLRNAGLPETLRFHDLRHGAASLLLSQGVPVPVVSEMLGHANPSITMAIYSHALPDSQQMVADAMEAMFAAR